MAKLNKQKFELDGSYVEGRTTFSGDIELHLHYNTSKEFFYFDRDELLKYFDKSSIPDYVENLFNDCDTKRKAVDVLMVLVKKNLKEKRMISMELGMPSKLYSVRNPEYDAQSEDDKSWGLVSKTIIDPTIPDFLNKILDAGKMYSAYGVSLSFQRVMEVEFNGVKRYASCDENWNYKRSNLHSGGHNLIEWSQEREDFLLGVQQKLDDLGKMILDYLNVPDIEEFYLKMETDSSKLLGNGK
jgi:hypothetical protein